MCRFWWGEGILGKENYIEELMCSGSEKFSVVEDKGG